MPTVDDLLGPEPQKPSVDDLLGPGPRPTDFSTRMHDLFLGNPDVDPTARVLDAIGQGVKQGWGASSGPALAPETEDYLKKAGVFNDWQNGHTSLLKSFNEAIIRPVAAAWQASQGAFGAVTEGIGAGAEQVGKELEQETGLAPEFDPLRGAAELARGAPQAFAGTPFGFGAPHVSLNEARSLNVIGHGDDAYMGTVEPTPVSEAEQAQAVKAQREEIASQPEAPGAPKEPAQPPAQEAQPAPDINQAVRQLQPDLFRRWDQLQAKRDTYQRWLGDLKETQRQNAIESAPHTDAIANIDRQIETETAKIPDATARLAKKYQARIEDLTGQRSDLAEANQSYIDEVMSKDSPDLAKVRQAFLQNDYQMRDMAEQVSAAYRQAREIYGAPEPVEAPAEQAPQQIAQPAEPEAAQPEAAQPEQAPAPAQPTAAPEAQPAQVAQPIAEMVAQKLANAGRPADEAQAAGALVQAHYETRAARLGTDAQSLYATDAPEIEGTARGRKGEMGRTILSDGKATIRLMKNADASTFIHETGHNWLNEMMRDAADERAPDDLKADAQTVRDWLGVGEGEIPTRAHEKFARGFERYMMEGVAPSQKLANVFAQFKDWLTKIYQTVAKLRSPISDDIRQVFDRMLTGPGEKPVIAPESAPELAERLDKIERETPPEKAYPVAVDLRAEVDQIAKEHELTDALTAEHGPAGTGAGGNPPENTESGGVGAEGRPDAGPVETGTGAGSDVANRSEAPAKGAGVLEAERPEPTGPNEQFGPTESRLIDKAGNIRLDNLNTPEDVNAVLRQAADENDNFTRDRRGVMTDGEVLDLADALGMDPAMLNRRKIGQAFNAEQIIAARKLLIKSATETRAAMIKAATGSDAEVMAYAEAKARHQMIQGQVSGITAEAGRALRAFRELEGSEEAKAVGDFIQEATGRTLFQLRREAQLGANLTTPSQISKYVDDLGHNKFKDAIVQYYVNALISGPITHARYAAGNMLNAIWTPLVEIPTASAIGKVREIVSGETEDRVHIGEAGAQLWTIGKGSTEGLRAAIQAFRTGISPPLAAERVSADFLVPRNAISELYTGTNPVVGGAVRGAGEALNIPSRSVAAIHSFFKTLRYEQNIQGLAYREALKEGLTGDAFAQRVADLGMRPTPAMMESATADALKELYMSPTEYNSAMGALVRFTNRNLLAKIMMPFMKIGTQITRNAFIERTPLGVASSEVRHNLMGQEGGAALDFQAAKMATGVALMGTMVALTLDGLATGDGPPDPKQRSVWLLTHRPNHLTIGNISIPYQGLGHLGMLMRFSANMTETAHGWGDKEGENMAVAFIEAITKSVLDDNFMRGTKDMLDAIYHPAEYGERYVQDFATNWLPYSVGLSQVARQIDPYQRQTKDLDFWSQTFDDIKRRVPIWSETLPARIDMFGNPIPNGAPLPDYSSDPAVKRLDELHTGIGRLGPKIRGVQLTPEQYQRYAITAGRLTKMMLDNFVRSVPSSTPQGIQLKLINQMVEKARRSAQAQMMMEYPSIIQAAVAAKTAALH